MHFRPGRWPTLMAGLALVLLTGLGFWQLDRLRWKDALLTDLAAARQAPPQPIPAGPFDPEDLRFRPLTVEGLPLAEPTFQVFSTRLQDWDTYRLLVRDNGPAVLTNGIAKDAAPQSRLVMTGIARLPTPPPWFGPDNQPQRNQWYWIDLQAMAEAAGLAEIHPLVIDARAWRDKRFPEPHNRHLEYAATWFAFAAILAIIYILYGLRRGREYAGLR